MDVLLSIDIEMSFHKSTQEKYFNIILHYRQTFNLKSNISFYFG